jgi:hypothetical protein
MKAIHHTSSSLHFKPSSLTLKLSRIGLALALTAVMAFVLTSPAEAKDVKID